MNNGFAYKFKLADKINKDKNPFLVLLHGYGSNEDDLFSLSQYFPNNYSFLSLRAPYQIYENGYSWFDLSISNDERIMNSNQAKSSISKISDIITLFQKEHNFKPEQTYVLGFSQGAVMSSMIGANYPKIVKKLVCLSGYFSENLLESNNLEEKNDKSFFISHGKNDEVIPLDSAIKSWGKFEKLGFKCMINEYNSGHHLIPENIYDVVNWLQS